jgi:hypothetical protein
MADETLITEVDFKALIREAQDLGIHYTGDDGVELHGLVAMARAEKGREHPVPCYGQSFDPTDRRCRICQLRNPCADLDHRPRVDVLEAKLQAIPCEACGKGMLEIELVNPETKEVRDYGCTTRGCPNSIQVQCGWESVGSEVVREIVLGEQTGSADPGNAAEEAAEITTDGSSAASEPEAGAPEPGATDPVGESAAPVPASKPNLRAIEGGKGKKKAARKVTVKRGSAKGSKKSVVVKRSAKKATSKKASKKTAKKTAKKKAPAKKQSKANGKMAFRALGETYTSLTALVNDITQSRNWSPAKFFAHVDTKAVKVGDKFSRDYNGTEVEVEVIKQ